MTTPLERAIDANVRYYGATADCIVGDAVRALTVAPDFDQLVEWLHLCAMDSPQNDYCVGCLVEAKGLGASEIEVLARAFIAYLQQGIEQEQPHLAAVAA